MKSLMDYISETQAGYALLVAGVVLLLNTFGILESWLKSFIIVGALYMIYRGLEKTHLIAKITALFNKIKK